MKRTLAIMFLLLISLSSVSAFKEDKIFTLDQMTVDFDLASGLRLTPFESDYRIDYVRTRFYFIPIEYSLQDVVSLDTTPDAEREDDHYVFEWTKPDDLRLSYGLSSRVTAYNRVIPVRKKILFPIRDLSSSYYEYTQPTSMIDVNQDIRDISNEIAKGEDDLYVVVFKLSDWVHENIEYDLNTLTAEAAQKSSWVLTNRYGVCDELTNLFIAMCRSLGIPARFVSGISYSNSELFDDPWGLHGWAEVYFPKVGWIPFDVTYGQLGFIDASHVKLSEALDANKSTSRFEWKSYGVNLASDPVNLDVKIVAQGDPVVDPIDISLTPFSDEVEFGSSNLIEAVVKNTEDYYVTTELILSKPTEVEVVEPIKRHILLKPNEEKSIFWRAKISDRLKQGFIYTFPLTVKTSYFSTAEAQIESSQKGISYTEDEIETIFDQMVEQEEFTKSDELDISCTAPEKSYVGENAQISCVIENTGDKNFSNLDVCLDSTCKVIQLEHGKSREVTFTYIAETVGLHPLSITARSNDASNSYFLQILGVDRPEISIIDLDYPTEVRFDESFDIEFKIKKESYTDAKDIHVGFSFASEFQEWNIEKLSSEKPFKISVSGSMLDSADTPFSIELGFKDENGNVYTVKKEFTVGLKDLTFWQKVQMFFSRLGKRFVDLMD